MQSRKVTSIHYNSWTVTIIVPGESTQLQQKVRSAGFKNKVCQAFSYRAN